VLVAGFPAGLFGTNCWVLGTGRGGSCVIVDPGQDAVDDLEDTLRQHRLSPVAVLLTHGHLDHTWSVVPVTEGHGIPAYLHSADAGMLADPERFLSYESVRMLRSVLGRRIAPIEPAEVRPLDDGTVLDLAGLRMTVRHAPGHTAGSVVMSLDEATTGAEPLLVSGDVLFAGSIGRTDLPGGDHAAMQRSLRDVVWPLDDATVVLPGHGDVTTIAAERAGNPFLRQFRSR
jgi:glyoxylase-like metal-dependent hydrolase (beta-lactamase superfamily II)